MTGPSRKVYVWRLVVTLPEGSDAPGWAPPEWDPYPYGYVGDREQNVVFTWPPRRIYLSAGAAARRATLLRRYGAEVVVERSEEVVWS